MSESNQNTNIDFPFEIESEFNEHHCAAEGLAGLLNLSAENKIIESLPPLTLQYATHALWYHVGEMNKAFQTLLNEHTKNDPL